MTRYLVYLIYSPHNLPQVNYLTTRDFCWKFRDEKNELFGKNVNSIQLIFQVFHDDIIRHNSYV